MNKQGKLTGVGLGPGEPELITVKGLRALQAADIIFYPATKVGGGNNVSFSARILDALELKVTCAPLYIPMSGKNRADNYQVAFDAIKKEYDAGRHVAVVSEGDLLFYSTFGYLLDLAKKEQMNYELIPGIPAFIAAGSQGVQAIVEGNQAFKVIARPDSFEQIEEALKENVTLVVMKMSVLKDWYLFLKNSSHAFFYIEKVGTDQQFSTTEDKDLECRTIPYFSLIVFYGQKDL
ncbi:precorrin-2 C(20)-methyltransferase [Saccharicrinis fermentans]|uniref:Precorrin-2 C(20)-methyltransferase n=1 Tax=Saccharicrinis fermentans DSM 9555 = JCM 21142 TaxID=869213 RepID=W7YHR5_9BACT|nr:precorrin-2 C(20)-methyltransferase [Saccharicrinis fermentans]GAF02089.1 precorrin-2 C(20)-methyltransferase [Saccharicrinis fermentans DSM 9555 = JCM 21142]